MIKLLVKWAITALAILLAAYLLEGVSVSSFYIALILAIIFGFLNALVRPMLVILTLPVTVLTLGIFIFIINGFLFWLPHTFIEGFEVDNFWWAMLGALLVSIFSWFGNKLVEDSHDE